MNNAAKSIAVPCRLQWLNSDDRSESPRAVIKGTLGAHGDAGWTVYNIPRESLEDFMAAYPSARMPCWRRLETR